jgi:hypothetical protein
MTPSESQSSGTYEPPRSSVAAPIPPPTCVNTLPNMDDEIAGLCHYCNKDVKRDSRLLMSTTHVFHRACFHRTIRVVTAPADYTATTTRRSFDESSDDRDDAEGMSDGFPKGCPDPQCSARTHNLAELLAHMRDKHQGEYKTYCVDLGGVECRYCGKIYTPKSIKQHIGRAHRKTSRATGKKRKTRPTTNTDDDDDDDDDDDEGGDSDDNPERPPPMRAHTHMLQGPVDTPMTREEMARARAIRYATAPPGLGVVPTGWLAMATAPRPQTHRPTATAPDPRAREYVYTYTR